MTRRLNVRLLIVLILGLVLTSVGISWIHDKQVSKSIDAYITRADAAEATGDTMKAARYLDSYLQERWDDYKVMARLGLLLARDPQAATRDKLEHAAKTIELVLIQEPNRTDLNLALLQLDMALGREINAKITLEKLIKEEPRNAEYHFLLARCLEQLGDYPRAAEEYDATRRDDPQRIEAYERLARLMRTRLREPAKADLVMDAREEPSGGVVVANPIDAAAYVARGRYRRDYYLKGADLDAEKAIELAPDDIDGLLLAALVVASNRNEPDLPRARKYLAHALEIHPKDGRIYKAAADIELTARDLEAAIVKLEQGVAAIPDNLFLRWLLVDLKIRTKRLDRSRESIADLQYEGLDREIIDYLSAQLIFYQERWADAIVALEAAAQGLGARQGLEELTKRTYITLGECYEKLGNIDQRYTAYRRATSITPSGVDRLVMAARSGLAGSLVALGRVDEAIEEYRKNLLLPEVTEGVRIVLARLLIFRNLRLPDPQRRWSEIESLLETSARALPDSTEVTVLRAEALAAQKQLDPARKLLEEARDKHPDQVELWVALSVLAVRQDRPEEALPILDEAQKKLGDLIEIRLARARFWGSRGGPEASAALDRLVEGSEKYPENARLQLGLGVADAHVRLGEVREAIALWTKFATLQPNNMQLRLLLFDAAVMTSDTAEMGRALTEIERIEGPNGSLWRYGRARMLITSAKGKDDPAFVEARSLLNGVIARRPAWPRAPLSIAEIDDRLQNYEAALKNYKLAIAFGERGSLAIRRTVQLLYQYRRYDQADQILRRLQEEMPISTELQRLAADISLQTRDYVRALDLARRAVSNESADYRDHVWLGQLLWAVSRRDDSDGRKEESLARRAEAERSLRRAAELGPDKPETWVALIQFLAETINIPAAEKSIAEAEKAIPTNLASLPLAIANESIGRIQRAELLYKQAVDAQPDDLPSIRGIANFFVKYNRIEEAKPFLNRLIDLRAQSPEDAAWARRILAIALSLEGREQLSLRALEILNTPDDPSAISAGDGDIDDIRAKARVYSLQRNRDRRREAIRLLEGISLRQGVTIDDRLLLAQLYQVDGNWTKCRDQLQAILAEETNNPAALSLYARGLIRRKQADDARPWLESLHKVAPTSAVLTELDARLAVVDGKPDRAVTIVKEYVRDKDSQFATCGGLLEDMGLYPAAEELFRRLAKLPGQPANVLTLAEYLGRRGQVREALDLCDTSWETMPAAQVALSSIKVLFAANITEADGNRVAAKIENAIRENPKEVALPFYLANVRILQHRYHDAEVIFRQAFEQNRENASPLNNLAWLLALQDGKSSEALQTINEAITIGGATPEHLDTRGLIHLNLGRADLAIKELEDAVSVAPTPDNNFHLARAYVAAKRPKDAAEALREAENLGLKVDSLHPTERQAYFNLVSALPRNSNESGTTSALAPPAGQ